MRTRTGGHRWHGPFIHALPQPVVGLGTGVLALAALAVAWRQTATAGVALIPAALALVLAGTVVVAYHYPIHVGHQTKVFLFTVAYYLLAVLAPPPLAALAAGLGALWGEVSRRRASCSYPSDIAAEVGRRIVIVLVGGLLAHAGGTGASSSGGLVGAALALVVLPDAPSQAPPTGGAAG